MDIPFETAASRVEHRTLILSSQTSSARYNFSNTIRQKHTARYTLLPIDFSGVPFLIQSIYLCDSALIGCNTETAIIAGFVLPKILL